MYFSTELPDSTPSNPINFFEKFFDGDYINQLRAEFFTDLNNEDGFYAGKVDNINITNECFDVNYTEEINWVADANEKLGCYPTHVESRFFTVYFKGELYKILRHQFVMAVDLIKENIENKDPKVCRATFKHWVGRSMALLKNIAADTRFNRYSSCNEVIEAIVRHVHVDYASFLPKPDPEIAGIIGRKSTPAYYEKQKVLHQSFYNEIIKITDNEGYTILHNDSEAKAKLLSLSGELSALRKMNFTWSVEAACYLVWMIQQYSNPSFKAAEILRSDCITFDQKPITHNRYSTAKHKFAARNSKLKDDINQLVRDNLSDDN
jgi:hypothetical protein